MTSTSFKNEGGNIVFTLTTTGLQDGDKVPFALSGTATVGVDYSDVSPKEFLITNNSSTYTVTTFQDNTTEGQETIKLTLDATDSQGNYTGSKAVQSFIGDTSQDPPTPTPTLNPTATPIPTATQLPTGTPPPSATPQSCLLYTSDAADE